MGTDLFANAVLAEKAFRESAPPTGEIPMGKLHAAVLAAPDISSTEFTSLLKQSLLQTVPKVVVYCSNDRALRLSMGVNFGDERLGYCTGKKTVSGVDVVSVQGQIADFTRHSYYLSAPKILDDMVRHFQTTNTPNRAGVSREILLP
jgi:esterase/lipase superfamily enzyme